MLNNMKTVRTFEEFNFKSNLFSWIKDMSFLKHTLKVYNLIKNVFNGDNYDEVCLILNEKFGTNIKSNDLRILTEKIYRNNNIFPLRESLNYGDKKRSVRRGGVASLIIGLVLAFVVMFPVYKISKNQYIDNEIFIQKIEKEGYDSVKYLDYEFIGPMVPSQRGSGFGSGIYKGIKDGKTYIIYTKALSKFDVIIIDVKIKE